MSFCGEAVYSTVHTGAEEEEEEDVIVLFLSSTLTFSSSTPSSSSDGASPTSHACNIHARFFLGTICGGLKFPAYAIKKFLYFLLQKDGIQ